MDLPHTVLNFSYCINYRYIFVCPVLKFFTDPAHFRRIGNNVAVSQGGEDTAAGAGSNITVAAGGLGTSVAAIVDGRGEDQLGSAHVPPSPKREARNPLLSSFTPSPSRQRHNALAGVFASTGGSQ